MDRAAIFRDLCHRNALRREARLPLLDLTAEYHRTVEVERWKQIAAEHYQRVRAEVVAERLRERGPGSCESAGARWLIEWETMQRLEERHR